MDKNTKLLSLSLAVSLILLLVVCFGVGSLLSRNSDTRQGATNQEYSIFKDGIQLNQVPYTMGKIKLESGATTGFYTNRSGRTEFITNPEPYSGGTASSTYKYYVVATTTESFTAAELNRGTPSGVALLSGWTTATSTAATTTDAILYGKEGGLSKSVYALPDGAKIAFVLENADIVSGVVEAASSTNRGVAPELRFGIHR